MPESIKTLSRVLFHKEDVMSFSFVFCNTEEGKHVVGVILHCSFTYLIR